MSGPPSQVPDPIQEIERRIRWPALPVLLFLGFMVGLGVVALIGIRKDPPLYHGLPQHADARQAMERVRAHVRLAPGTLRFASALTGELPDRPPRETRDAHAENAHSLAFARRSGRDEQGVQEALALIEQAIAREPREPRLMAALACLDLILGTLPRAERGYRRVLERAPGYGEARLGLGMVLAARAAEAPDSREQRRLRLQAIAQCAAVRPDDWVHPVALYDRAVLLAAVDRPEEARRLAARYRAELPRDSWGSELDDRVASNPER